ncbi:mechanosensitive ion channel family protein, partial [bacterium]|nr:mechanosensitive ion channel family protein [bacterium]
MNRLAELLVKRTFRRADTMAFLLIVLHLIPFRTVAQENYDADPELPGIQQALAPVKVDGIVLFNVRGMSSFTAEQRAAAISKRIKNAAADQAVSADSLRTITEGDHLAIYAEGNFLMNVYDQDSEVEQISTETLAYINSQKIRETIKLYRLDRSRPVLIQKSINALIALIIQALALVLILWLFRLLSRVFQNRITARIDNLETQSFSLIRANQIWKIYNSLIRLIRIIIIVVFVAFSLDYLLGLFPWTKNVSNYFLKLLGDPFVSMGKGLLQFLPDLAFLVVLYFVVRYLLKLSRLLFKGIQEGGITVNKFDPDWAMPTYRIFRIFVVVFAVIIAYPYIPGSDSSAFKGISVFIGVLFSLGSSSFISNLIAGYSMTYRGAFKTGDRIQIGDHVGFVEEQEVLVTRLRTIKNEEVIIPNSTMLNSNIINYTKKARDRGLIIHTTVGIGYETPWRMVEAMLKEAADRTEGLLKEPPPFVLQLSLGDFAVNYEINAYTNDTLHLKRLYTLLHQNILDVFNENNVQIMTPRYESDPNSPKVVPQEQWN